MPLDPQTADFLQMLADAGAKPFSDLPPSESRKAFSTLISMLPPSQAQLANVEDRRVPGPAGDIPIRIYTPKGEGPFGVLVYVHGGGFVIGSVEDYDPTCREVCAGAGCIVVSVEYRLAPEHPFPAAPEDAFAALNWVAKNASSFGGDPGRLVVGGDSAGGNLAAVMAQRARNAGGPELRGQMLIYPVTNVGEETDSLRDNAEGYLLTRAEMDYFVGHYVTDEAALENPDLCPARADSLAGLPPAWVATCEFDPLRDDGEAYAQALQKAGVEVHSKRYDGAIHGSWNFFSSLELGRQLMDDAIDWLKTRLS